MRKWWLVGLVVVAAGLWVNNTSMFVDVTAQKTRVLSHRGVHQTFSRENLANDTCTAERIGPVEHGYLENTIPSMRAAFDAGADVVELDVHLTADNQFAVFHDWTVDCRTEGTGVTQTLSMGELKRLDVGYGYTSDGGESYPLRGTGVGLMPSLDEVFRALPDRQFLINFKSRRVEEGEALVSLLNENAPWRDAVFGAYGGSEPTEVVMNSALDIPGYDRDSLLRCMVPYLLAGWSGWMPGACERSIVVVPANYSWLMWGWPHRFTRRMAAVGTEVILVGPYDGSFTAGIDEADQIHLVPAHFDGYVWTNKVEVIGPLLDFP